MLSFQFVMIQDFTQFSLDPFLAQAKFLKRIFVRALEFALTVGGVFQLGVKFGTYCPAKVGIDLFNGLAWMMNQVPVINAVIARRVYFLPELKQMFIP